MTNTPNSNRGFNKRTIAQDLTVRLIFVISAVIVTFGTLNYAISIRQMEKGIMNRAVRIAERFGSSLALPLWQLDQKAIHEISKDYMPVENIIFIRVSDDFGEVIFERRAEGKVQRLIEHQKEVVYQDHKVGTIDLALSGDKILLAQKTIIRSTVINIIVVILTILAVTARFMNTLLTRPINQLINGIRTIAQGKYDHRLPFVRHTDMNAINQEVNAMAEQISDRTEQLHTEISDRIRAETALRESEERYRTLFDQASDAIFLENEAEEILDANRAAGHMFGYDRDSLLQMKTSDLQPPKSSDKTLHLLQEESFNKPVEILAKRSSGTVFPIEVTMAPLTTREQTLYLSILRDITERKRNEEKIRKMNEELEQRVVQRTADLQEANKALETSLDTLQKTQAHLVESEKMAALGNLVAGVAHEINTPVGVSVTAASYLEQATSDFQESYRSGKIKRSHLASYVDTACESSEMILSNLRRASDLISSFKQVAVDQTSVERRKFNPNEYIGDILRSLYPELKKRQHKIMLNCPEDLEITSYPSAFYQILLNLIMNSIKHGFADIQAGEIRIDVTVSDGKLILMYRDNGQGIPETSVVKIFDPFFTTQRSQGSSGLGLHLVYNMVTQNLDGKITCDSKRGEGTKFTIEMPISES